MCRKSGMGLDMRHRLLRGGYFRYRIVRVGAEGGAAAMLPFCLVIRFNSMAGCCFDVILIGVSSDGVKGVAVKEDLRPEAVLPDALTVAIALDIVFFLRNK